MEDLADKKWEHKIDFLSPFAVSFSRGKFVKKARKVFRLGSASNLMAPAFFGFFSLLSAHDSEMHRSPHPSPARR
jgi:hypothetical protein